MKKGQALGMGRVILFGLVACFLYGVGAGLRSDVGILLQPMLAQTGLGYADVSLCVAVLQLVFGASQPFFGLLATRWSNRSVLLIGVLCLLGGLAGIALSTSFLGLFLALGVLLGLGTGAISFGLVFTSAAYFVGEARAMLVSGMLNAAAGMTGFVFAPLLTHLLATGGLAYAMLVMSLVTALLVPVTLVVTARDPRRGAKDREEVQAAPLQGVRTLIREAARSRTYRLLIAGFSTCGFHMVIIESHLFSQFTSYGIEAGAASWAFSVYGIATIAGALLSGYLSTRVKKGGLLAFCYGFRAVWVAVYLFLLPKTIVTAVLFAIGLGLTGDATVSPTSGLVSRDFSLEKVATLVGFLFLCHQVGAFVSAYLGGILVEATGGYTLIWSLDIAVCLFAAAASWRIERA